MDFAMCSSGKVLTLTGSRLFISPKTGPDNQGWFQSSFLRDGVLASLAVAGNRQQQEQEDEDEKIRRNTLFIPLIFNPPGFSEILREKRYYSKKTGATRSFRHSIGFFQALIRVMPGKRPLFAMGLPATSFRSRVISMGGAAAINPPRKLISTRFCQKPQLLRIKPAGHKYLHMVKILPHLSESELP